MDKSIKKIFNRIYADYFMPSRMKEYEDLLRRAIDLGYRHVTIREFYSKIIHGESNGTGKYFIHRHDIDTDTKTASRFFEIEKNMNLKTSYYFRRSTMNVRLMRKIYEYGSEVGYHYEELAQYCKVNKIKSAELAQKNYADIKLLFKNNFLNFQQQAGFKIKSICSHGDFVNTILNIPNYYFITPELMQELGIELEGYDLLLWSRLGTILADDSYPRKYICQNPFDCLKEQPEVIYLLTHPRHWNTAIWVNTKNNFQRLWEGIKFMS